MKKKTVKKKRKASKKNQSLVYRPESVPFPKDLNDVDYNQVKHLNKALNNSRILWDLERIEDMIDSPVYKLNKWEIDALQAVFEKFKAKYKNKLTEALD